MKPLITGIDPSEDGYTAVHVEFADEEADYPRSAGLEIWIDSERAAGLTLEEIRALATEGAYSFLQEILAGRDA